MNNKICRLNWFLTIHCFVSRFILYCLFREDPRGEGEVTIEIPEENNANCSEALNFVCTCGSCSLGAERLSRCCQSVPQYAELCRDENVSCVMELRLLSKFKDKVNTYS